MRVCDTSQEGVGGDSSRRRTPPLASANPREAAADEIDRLRHYVAAAQGTLVRLLGIVHSIPDQHNDLDALCRAAGAWMDRIEAQRRADGRFSF